MPQSFIGLPTLAEFPQWQPFLTSKEQNWTGITIERFRLTECETPEISFANHIICVMNNGSHAIEWQANVHKRQVNNVKGDINILPSDFRHVGYGEATEYTAIHLEPRFLKQLMQEEPHGDTLELVPNHSIHDEFIGTIARHLLTEAQMKPSARLRVESLAVSLAVHWVRQYAATSLVIREYKGGLSPNALRLVIDYINDNLDRNISLLELAGLTNLSLHHFARMFKQSTQLTPHQYMIRQRIERAKKLLIETDTPITEIALHVGCADASHFSHLFRQFVGLSPAAYRKTV